MIIYIIAGILCSSLVVWFFMHRQNSELSSRLMLSEQMMEVKEKTNQRLEQQAAESRKEIAALQHELMSTLMETQKLRTQLMEEQKQNEKESQLRHEQFQEQLRTVQAEMSNLASRVLEQTAGRLKDTNSEAMQAVTQPLKEKISQLQEAIQQTNTETARTTASLSEQIKAMGQQTVRINQAATQLTNAIRGGSQQQGNWGERVLSELLQSQGYRPGIDYDEQQTITDEKGNPILSEETGRRMIPDVILHYPNNEDVIIDAKTTIESYYQYVNTEDPSMQKKYADDLVKNIRAQMTGLAKKDYSRYVKSPRQAIEFVIMFVPNEGALQLALAHDPKIWGEAFSKQIFLTSQQNLMAILKIIQVAWRQYTQTENQKRLFAIADELLKRIGEFIKRFDKVGKDIEALHRDYDEAYNKAHTGRQSIVQKANELKQLGVKESPAQPIPMTEFTD